MKSTSSRAIPNAKAYRSDQMCAEYSVGGFVGEHFDEAVRVVVGLGARIGHEREFAHFVFDAFGLQCFLGLADPGHLRVGVHNAWHAIVVDVHVAAFHALDADDALVLGFVGQHRAVDDVADGINTV